MWRMNRKCLQKNERGKYFCTVHDSLVSNYHRVQLRPRIKVQRNTQLHDLLYWKSLYPFQTKSPTAQGRPRCSLPWAICGLPWSICSWPRGVLVGRGLLYNSDGSCSVTPVTASGFIFPAQLSVEADSPKHDFGSGDAGRRCLGRNGNISVLVFECHLLN